MQGFLLSVGERLVPVLRESKFQETGRLTPEEFVTAGDYLVFKCPTWSWAGGEEARRRPYLPRDKQFLVTRNVPGIPADVQTTLEETASADEPGEFSRVWTAREHVQEITEMCTEDSTSPCKDADDIPDMDEFASESNIVVADDPALHVRGDEQPFLATQTFDLFVTYDKYYQTPRMWMSGYDKDGTQLAPDAVLNLLSQDHAHKTVTIETFPHLSISFASVHPCKHAAVMKKIIDQYMHGEREIRVDQYMVLFLKFMSSVMPSVDYDHTMSME